MARPAPSRNYLPHPVLDVLPPLTPIERERGAERVGLYGQTQAIEVVGGRILNGYDEHLACVDAGVVPTITEIAEPPDVVEYVMRALPRNLSVLDRAVIAVLAEEQWKQGGRARMRAAGREGGSRKGREESTRPFGHERWFEAAARIVGASANAVKKLAHLRVYAPDVFDAVRSRRLTTLQDAVKLASSVEEVAARTRVIETFTAGPRSPTPIGRLIWDEHRKARAPLAPVPGKGASWVIHEGPMAREGARVPSGSIDGIYADIPYGIIPIAVDVGNLAARVLRPGGVLALATGNEQSLEILLALRGTGLELVAVGASYLPDSRAVLKGRVNRVDSIPLWFFTRKKERLAHPLDHLHFTSSKEKDLHPWQKSISEMKEIVRAMVPEGARVLDPCCGSGTTGVAALDHQCEFIGIDVDLTAVKTARGRLAMAEKGSRSM